MGDKCKILWFEDHKFDQWTIKDSLSIMRSDDKTVVGKTVIQSRKCQKCGLTEFKKDKQMYL